MLDPSLPAHSPKVLRTGSRIHAVWGRDTLAREVFRKTVVIGLRKYLQGD